MSIDKFKRVIWRLQEMKTKETGVYTTSQIRLAIMEEIGTDERTITSTTKKLVELKMMTGDGMPMGHMRIRPEYQLHSPPPE